MDPVFSRIGCGHCPHLSSAQSIAAASHGAYDHYMYAHHAQLYPTVSAPGRAVPHSGSVPDDPTGAPPSSEE